MTIRTIKTKVYTIESHPNPELCYDWIRNNWHSLGNYVVQEALDSLKAFAEHIDATLDYYISVVPDRGEYISLEVNENITLDDILPDLDLSGGCPFTGVCYDEIILDAFRDDSNNNDLDTILKDIEYRVLKAIHDEGEYIYSDEGLYELCLGNDYQFKESGEIDY
jgi:hypothetical protein